MTVLIAFLVNYRPRGVEPQRPEDVVVRLRQEHLVVDSSSTYKAPTFQRWLVRHPRLTLHFIPTYSRWMNLVELVRRAYRLVAATGNASLGKGAGGIHPDMDHQLE